MASSAARPAVGSSPADPWWSAPKRASRGQDNRRWCYAAEHHPRQSAAIACSCLVMALPAAWHDAASG